MANYLSKDADLVNNPATRVPVCLCLDLSGSMGEVESESGTYRDTGRTVMEDGKLYHIVEGGTSRIEELQKGIELFFEAIKDDDTAVDAAEVSIVGFSDKAECLLDFAHIEKQSIPHLVPSGSTAMGEGVNLALEKLEERKKLYKENGVQYFQPWLVIMSDGENNGSNAELQKAIDKIEKMVSSKKLTIFAIGIGKEADMNVLAKLSPARRPLRLNGMKFSEFFQWLSASVSRTSVSQLGDKPSFSPVEDWATL